MLDDLTIPAPVPSRADWNDDGVVILPGILDRAAIGAYAGVWRRENGWRGLDADDVLRADEPGGWADCTPYMRHVEILDLLAPLAPVLEDLLAESAGVHLNLTGWITTERDWHQDSYLNPPHVGDAYAAVWCALGAIHPDSGPFQYVPGSHRWPQVTQGLIGRHVDLSDPQWPKHSERVLSPLFEQQISRRGAEVVTHLPDLGDVLVWHGRLLHRGSRAMVPGMFRPGFIAHFSGIHHREDMPAAVKHERGGWYFPLLGTQPAR